MPQARERHGEAVDWSRSPTLSLAAGALAFVGQAGLLLVMLPGDGPIAWVGVALLTSLYPVSVPAALVAAVVGVRALRADAPQRRRAVAGLALAALAAFLWIQALALSNLSNLSNLDNLRNL